MKNGIIVAVFALALAGCASAIVQTEGVKIDRAQALNIKIGSTTRQDVLQTFGSPTAVNNENNEEKMVYVFRKKTVPTYFGGLIESEAQRKEASSTLEIVLRNGVVDSYRFKSMENGVDESFGAIQ